MWLADRWGEPDPDVMLDRMPHGQLKAWLKYFEQQNKSDKPKSGTRWVKPEEHAQQIGIA